MQKFIRTIIVVASSSIICCLILWFAVPFVQMAWELLFPSYDHKVAVLPFDLECRCDSADGTSKTIVLPKGLMVYSPCSHDYSRMSLDEKETYKIYLKLDAKTIKALYKDSDKTRRREFLDTKKYGELEEVHK